MELIKTVTNKGNECVFYNNFKYRKIKVLKSGEVYWRCTNRHCNTTIHTDANETKVTRLSNDHSHDSLTTGSIQKQVVKSECKRKAVEDINNRPLKIMRETLTTYDNTEMRHEDIGDIRQAIYRARRKKILTQPRSIDEIIEHVRLMTGKANKCDKFSFTFNDMIIERVGQS